MKPRRPPTINSHTWAVAQRVCTEPELLTLELDARGLPQRTIAIHLGISRATVRDRLWNANRKIAAALQEPAA